MVPQGYGLNASVSVTQRVPKSPVSGVVVALGGVRETVEQAVHALEHRARTDGNPLRASSAARIPDCAAQPACSRLVQAPSARYSMIPPAMLPAIAERVRRFAWR